MINKTSLAVLFFVFSSHAVADHPRDEIESLLSKMHHAAHMMNYDGTFVYGQSDKLSSMQIIHSVDARGEFERLISLDGSGREVIRTGDTVTCVLPDKNSVVVDKSRPDAEFPPQFPVEIDHLSSHYDFHIRDKSRVAGQIAQLLVITPKDEYRYGHKLWVDSATGLLLKNYLVGDNDKIVEQFMFTQINYPEKIDKSRLKSLINDKNFTWYKAKENEQQKVLKNMSWKVTNLPPGFKPSVERHHQMTMSAMPVEHFVFSDGLSSVSVFVEKQMENSKNLVGGSTMGAVNAYGRSIGDFHVTVVGEVPQVTVKLIGDSVKNIK